MMAGIEVLSQEVVKIKDFNIDTFCITLVVCALIGFIAAIIVSDSEMFVIGCMLGIILGIFIGLIFEKDTGNTYIKYKVTISDEVSFNDFQERYEVISQEGKIYTIKEKEK